MSPCGDVAMRAIVAILPLRLDPIISTLGIGGCGVRAVMPRGKDIVPAGRKVVPPFVLGA
jgi:hypothetical protein